ncbi:MAG: Rrf2 family transcriptional regulator [Sedimentisphaerales bacterium]|nr:Rrf2 family transcriptional regulator [Sedimentisphaerales bacterium]
MDLIRRNTDYALRLAANLAAEYASQSALSATVLSKKNSVPYPLTCKLLQKFQQAGFVKSTLGSKGGFQLAREPKDIHFKALIEVIQGPISVNRCLLGPNSCPMKGHCPLHPKLVGLQKEIERHLTETTLADVVGAKTARK